MLFKAQGVLLQKKIHDIYVPNYLRIHCTMYAPLHQFGSTNFIKFTFVHPPWEFVTKFAQLFFTFTYEAFKVYKTC